METERTNIAVLGSTGSIGTQTLDVIRRSDGRFRASVLTARRNVDILIEQAREFRPDLVVIDDESLYGRLRDGVASLGIEAAAGPGALADAMSRPDFKTVVTATVGYSGLRPTLEAIANNKTIALANKETMVVAGQLVNDCLRRSSSKILPVDSEHSAIYQCLAGERHSAIDRLIITASGGPFRTWPAERIAEVTPADALRHPRWVMGAKITIDSATMMNKAFEIIEARWLFDVEPQRIEAVIHPQSIVHSMVQFADGAVKAQLGLPDMRLPIAYALGETERLDIATPRMSLADYATLTFEAPDLGRFPSLGLAHRALDAGGTAACAINAANEVAVDAFLHERLRYVDIYNVVADTLATTTFVADPTLDDYEAVNLEARRNAARLVETLAGRKAPTPLY